MGSSNAFVWSINTMRTRQREYTNRLRFVNTSCQKVIGFLPATSQAYYHHRRSTSQTFEGGGGWRAPDHPRPPARQHARSDIWRLGVWSDIRSAVSGPISGGSVSGPLRLQTETPATGAGVSFGVLSWLGRGLIRRAAAAVPRDVCDQFASDQGEQCNANRDGCRIGGGAHFIISRV
jgi:hypothetical protein